MISVNVAFDRDGCGSSINSRVCGWCLIGTALSLGGAAPILGRCCIRNQDRKFAID